MSIRKVNPKDKNELKKLANKYIVPLYGNQRKALKGWLTGYNYKTAWVFEDNEKIAGLVAVSDKPNKNYIKISTLVVKTPYQQKNIGKQLLNIAIIYTLKSKKSALSVTVGEDIKKSIA